jgi:hypothetical protein
MARQYDQLASLKKPIPSPWEVLNQTRDAPVTLKNDQGFLAQAMGIILVALFLTACAMTLLLFGVGLEVITATHRKVLFWVGVFGIWVPAVGLIFERIHNANQVKVYVLPADPARIEVIRFIRTKNDALVPPEDLVRFLEVSAATGRSGKQAWRKVKLPSGMVCNDEYHDKIIEALVEADAWEPGKGERSGGKLKGSLEEAIARVTR